MVRNLAKNVLSSFDWEMQQKVLEMRALFLSSVRGPADGYSFSQVAAIPKHSDPTKLIDRLLRYQVCLGEKLPFAGRTVLELGAGPLLGWAFVALALGAKKYYMLEPAFNPNLLTKFDDYFKQHRRYVCRVLGDVGSLDDVMSNGYLHIIPRGADNTGLPDGAVDLILSNSVLEHIHTLPDVVRELHRISSRQCTQFHFVDFKDHSGGQDPFSRLYPYHPDRLRSLFARRGLLLNMLRASDLHNLFSLHFDVQQTVFLENSSCPSIREAHPYWRDHYSNQELGIEVMAIKSVPLS